MYFNHAVAGKRTTRTSLTSKLCWGAILVLSASSLAQADDSSFRILSLNIWNKFKQTPQATESFMTGGDWDILLFQEANDSRYVSDIPDMLKNAGRGNYSGQLIGDVGLLSRLPGSQHTYTAPGINTQGRYINYQSVNADAGRPAIMVGTVHMDYQDSAAGRIAEAKAINQWTKQQAKPFILAGDLNAGDVSERGLHSKSQQELLLRIYTRSPNDFYYSLLKQYAKDQTALDQFISKWKGQPANDIDAAPIPSDLFADETYPVSGNTPQTMNILKKQFILLQNAGEREGFSPHQLNDGSVTWPSAGEDDTNTWGSWHRVKIDHFLAARPFGKWLVIDDDPNDPNLGVISDVYVNRDDGTRTPLSDHDPVAHQFRWIGPRLETFISSTNGGASTEKSRLVWDNKANTFASGGGEFYLTRNNMRTDVYLGQISDADGVPIFTDLTDSEKKTLLNCKSTDARLRQAIIDYCIDDHSFIGETLIKDKGTVIVDEDAALGSAAATLRLSGGTLRVVGTEMNTLDRRVQLETGGGTLDVADRDNILAVERAISGPGSLTKSGTGTLDLLADNTYTGDTLVRSGRLSVNGSTIHSGNTTVFDGASIGGNGTTGSLTIASGGILAPGNSIGTLRVSGDANLAGGSLYQVEVSADGRSDLLQAAGKITIDGGNVAVLAENTTNLLTQDEVASFNGKRFRILDAAQGISGTFESVVPDYLFLGTGLTYDASGVTLTTGRNSRPFASVAMTANERAVAAAIDSLPDGQPVRESILLSTSPNQARAAFNALTGQVHADVVSALTSESGQIRDTLYDRLYQADGRYNPADIRADTDGTWARMIGNWGRTEAGNGMSGFDDSAYGVLFGSDTEGLYGVRVGLAGGYTHTSLDSNRSGNADADNFHFAGYGSWSAGALALRGGAAINWHHINTNRRIAYNLQQDSATASYNARSAQLFAEAGWTLFNRGLTQLEPYAGLNYTTLTREGFSEKGGLAALNSAQDEMHAVTSETGLRGETGWQLNKQLSVILRVAAGWQHHISPTEREMNLRFNAGNAFTIASPSSARDSAVVKAAIGVQSNEDLLISLNYGGQLSGARQSNSAGAELSWSF
ncbi:autotransporter domain-containing protein [Biostraticola tofi]|uniref:Outer membrane autotransporter protein n=1 Tax=Biostraticola tofi TaxID=466109 RepID=A0A4R3YK48_9GAMM|nr:autotransporter domain-containing protein [Biostraticola tofi]TCV92482.1 outer membrane autotransporter protein [Biostraticola tofi]